MAISLRFEGSVRAEGILASMDLSQTSTILLDMLDPETRSPRQPRASFTREPGALRQTLVVRDITPGQYLLRLCLQDSAGTDLMVDEELASVAIGQVTDVTFDASGDDDPPAVAFTAPTEGQTVSGDVVLRANAEDDRGVTRVEFFVDNVSIGLDLAPPYQCNWNSTAIADGSHTLAVVAEDTFGQTAAHSISVQVSNGGDDPPSVNLTAPTTGQTVSGTVLLEATAADDAGVSQVEFFVDGVSVGVDLISPYQQSWNSATVANGAHAVSAVARDTAGQTGSHEITVNVANAVDNPPTVNFTAPTNGQNVSGTFTLEAAAADDVGVSQVEFFVDAVSVGMDLVPPYQQSWNTAAVANGAHVLSVVARDTAGQTASHEITVNVSNVDNPPTVNFTAPTDGQTVTGIFTLQAAAADDVGVTQVEFFADNVFLGVDLAAPYQHSWNTTALPDGSLHDLRAEARDTGGQTTSHSIQVTVQNTYVFSFAWGSSGNGPLQFRYPHGIAADRTNGFIHLSDTGNHLIKKYLPDGTHQATWGGVQGTRGISVTRTGNVLAGDSGTPAIEQVLEFDGTSGLIVNNWGTPGSGDGQFNFPVGVAASYTRDEAYVLDYHNRRVQAFALVGGVWTFDHKWGSFGAGSGQFNNPEGIAVDTDENVYVADSANNRIQKFAPDGTHLLTFGSAGGGLGQLSGPNGVAVDDQGCIYVVEFLNNRIQKFTPDGTPLSIFGTSGPGRLNHPYAACWYQGKLFVADTYNHRVVVFAPAP